MKQAKFNANFKGDGGRSTPADFEIEDNADYGKFANDRIAYAPNNNFSEIGPTSRSVNAFTF